MKQKANVLPFDKDWHLKLSTKNKESNFKVKKILGEVEQREALRLATRPRPQKMPTINWADPSEQLFSVDDLAKHFKVSPITIDRAEKRGELIAEPCGKNGRIKRFSRASVDAYKNFLASKRYG